MRSPGFTPARAAGVSSIGEITLMKPPSCVTSMPEAAELAARLHLHVAVVALVQVGGVRVEARSACR